MYNKADDYGMLSALDVPHAPLTGFLLETIQQGRRVILKAQKVPGDFFI
jgi:hypothetical protein